MLLGLGIGAGGLEKHKDVAGSIGSSYRLEEGTITVAGARGVAMLYRAHCRALDPV